MKQKSACPMAENHEKSGCPMAQWQEKTLGSMGFKTYILIYIHVQWYKLKKKKKKKKKTQITTKFQASGYLNEIDVLLSKLKKSESQVLGTDSSSGHTAQQLRNNVRTYEKEKARQIKRLSKRSAEIFNELGGFLDDVKKVLAPCPKSCKKVFALCVKVIKKVFAPCLKMSEKSSRPMPFCTGPMPPINIAWSLNISIHTTRIRKAQVV